MDDIIKYIFILILIFSFFSSLFKKKEKEDPKPQRKATPPESGEKTDGEKILEELFGIKTEEPEKPPQPVVVREKVREVRRKPEPSPQPAPVNKYARYNNKEFVKPSRDTLIGDVDSLDNAYAKRKDSIRAKGLAKSLKTGNQVRNAIILKEILDKPLALRKEW